MGKPLTIPANGALDFLALGALVHRLDPGVVPFHKAQTCTIHVSGGEYNTPPTCPTASAPRPVSPPLWSTIRSAP